MSSPPKPPLLFSGTLVQRTQLLFSKYTCTMSLIFQVHLYNKHSSYFPRTLVQRIRLLFYGNTNTVLFFTNTSGNTCTTQGMTRSLFQLSIQRREFLMLQEWEFHSFSLQYFIFSFVLLISGSEIRLRIEIRTNLAIMHFFSRLLLTNIFKKGC